MPIYTDPAAASGLPTAFQLIPFMRRPPGDVIADDDEPGRRKILRFPAPPADRCRIMSRLATAVAERLDADHVELFQAASDLLGLDDTAFALRMSNLQADDAGKALLAEFFSAVRCAAVDFDRGCRVLFTLSARLTASLDDTRGQQR